MGTDWKITTRDQIEQALLQYMPEGSNLSPKFVDDKLAEAGFYGYERDDVKDALQKLTNEGKLVHKGEKLIKASISSPNITCGINKKELADFLVSVDTVTSSIYKSDYHSIDASGYKESLGKLMGVAEKMKSSGCSCEVIGHKADPTELVQGIEVSLRKWDGELASNFALELAVCLLRKLL